MLKVEFGYLSFFGSFVFFFQNALMFFLVGWAPLSYFDRCINSLDFFFLPLWTAYCITYHQK